jgi:hypothetical protein
MESQNYKTMPAALKRLAWLAIAILFCGSAARAVNYDELQAGTRTTGSICAARKSSGFTMDTFLAAARSGAT